MENLITALNCLGISLGLIFSFSIIILVILMFKAIKKNK